MVRLRKTALLNCLPLTTKKQQILNSSLLNTSAYLTRLYNIFQMPNLPPNHTIKHTLTCGKPLFCCLMLFMKPVRICGLNVGNLKTCLRDVRQGSAGDCLSSLKPNGELHALKLLSQKLCASCKRDGGYKRFEKFLEDGWEIKSISLLDGKIAVSIQNLITVVNTLLELIQALPLSLL